ncbi:MAG: hypothetical protein Q7T87_12020 [Polaromonas sp.]|nr:hypothetical protein [Polaromonas sp.]
MTSTRSTRAGSTGDTSSDNGNDQEASQAESAAPARKARATGGKTQDRASAPDAASAPAIQTWPFAAGSQGDNKPLPSRPVQKAGWNARQFRI